MPNNTASFASYDLHLHTHWSYDATAEPEVYFRRARELGMRCLAITEHHNIDSSANVQAVAEQYPEIRLIVAAELTVHTSIGSVDLLCYNLPRRPEAGLANVLAAYHQWQRDYGGAFSKGMQALGFDYTDEARLEVLRSYRPEIVLQRQGITHVKNGIQVQAFVDRGYIADASAFPDLKKRLREVVTFPHYPAVERVVPAVKNAGGVVAIAHPSRYFLENDRDRMDSLRKECHLDGIECAHRTVKPELTTEYRQYCLQHGLFSVAGSDSHDNIDVEASTRAPGGYTPKRVFASHIGQDAWLDEFLAALK